jgi:hypothetical protein
MFRPTQKPPDGMKGFTNHSAVRFPHKLLFKKAKLLAENNLCYTTRFSFRHRVHFTCSYLENSTPESSKRV